MDGVTDTLHEAGTRTHRINSWKLARISTPTVQANVTIQQTAYRITHWFSLIVTFNQHRKQPGDSNRSIGAIDPSRPFDQLSQMLEH